MSVIDSVNNQNHCNQDKDIQSGSNVDAKSTENDGNQKVDDNDQDTKVNGNNTLDANDHNEDIDIRVIDNGNNQNHSNQNGYIESGSELSKESSIISEQANGS